MFRGQGRVPDPAETMQMFPGTFYLFVFKIKCTGVTLVNKLDSVQVYNAVTHHLQAALCAHQPKSILLLPPQR